MTSQKESRAKAGDGSGNGIQVSANGRRSRLPRRPLTAAHKDRLESIKSVAAELFYRFGYSATDLRLIADETGMHVASLYNYISGKEDLLFQIMKDGVVEINASLDDALEGCSDPLERLKRGLISHIAHHAHRRHLGAVSHTEVRSLTGNRRTRMIKMRRDYEARWDDLVINGMKAGIINPGEPRVIVYALLSVGQSVSRWYDPSGKIAVEELAENLTNMLLFGLIGRLDPSGDASKEPERLSASRGF
jgi:TetR/AcrR family transcriptional regulator, cholesterol catabolism regulator